MRCARSTTRASSTSASFSKTLAPGFRVGWALAPHAIREKLILANESAVLSPELVQPARHLRVPRDGRLEGPDRHLPRRLPRAQGGHDLGAGGVPARRSPGPTRTAASTSGSPCPTSSTPRRCCPAPSRSSSRTRPARRSSPTAAGARTSVCRSAIRRPSRSATGIRRLATVINGELDLLDDLRRAPARLAAADAHRACRRRRRTP